MTRLTLVGSQTLGPFFAICLTRENRPDSLNNVLASAETAGERIRIEGSVLDGDGAPMPDAMIELWQANAFGRYNHPSDTRDVTLDPSFSGFGRAATDDAGRYWFETIKPGGVPGPNDHIQAPHIVVTVFARGMLNHAVTRLYFADDPANERDPILALVPAERHVTLLAQPLDRAEGNRVYRFDIVLQGSNETAFFQV